MYTFKRTNNKMDFLISLRKVTSPAAPMWKMEKWQASCPYKLISNDVYMFISTI